MYIARSKKFDKQYQKLPKNPRQQFSERLQLYLEHKENSLLHVHSLVGEYRGLYSFNVNADLRAVFKIKDSDTIYF